MDAGRIAQLLQPFAPPLTSAQFENISTYIDILLRWNARVNLTAVREPEAIVTRHFGESLFAAARLFPAGSELSAQPHVVDVGSGAGFPGLPIKIWAPPIHLTLIESNQKKATFLREVARRLTLTDVDVVAARAEDFPPAAGDVVTLRAVERFDRALPVAVRLARVGGRVAGLVGRSQVERARELAAAVRWEDPVAIPQSSSRVLLIGTWG
ncbi:MAG TPA: 16S rRNA (guanine(527)-N(7))-methyltransferase RsmG [Terriglobales bacterium]|jgi:16S rRNA (guanine527-N7)-methyltransferase|nr:16S rRNA (guanine(527)-N(7))-methyltransferase RsmG [Terriglobales bacterium]